MLATTVYADKGLIEIYKPDEVFDLSIHLTNITGEVTGANCKTQIRNESYDTLENLDMNEIAGGWYNLTYNQSKVGKYFCRQNCTQGDKYTAETCDFVIRGEDMSIAIIIMLGIIILVALWLVKNLSTELLAQHGLIKSAIVLFVFWFLLIPLNFGIESLGFNGASASMINLLSNVHTIMIYLNLLLTAYFIIYVIVSFMRSMNENVKN